MYIIYRRRVDLAPGLWEFQMNGGWNKWTRPGHAVANVKIYHGAGQAAREIRRLTIAGGESCPYIYNMIQVGD